MNDEQYSPEWSQWYQSKDADTYYRSRMYKTTEGPLIITQVDRQYAYGPALRQMLVTAQRDRDKIKQ